MAGREKKKAVTKRNLKTDQTWFSLVLLPMKTINIQAAKTHLSRLVDEVVAGEEVVLAKAGKPLVRLVPFRAPGVARCGGQFAGQIEEAPDCWEGGELDESIAAPLYHAIASATPLMVAEGSPE